MKKTILLSSILAVGAAFASVTVDSTEIGVMGIAMPTNAALIAVPFLGYDTPNIKVADMVNTAGLAEDSELYVPNASGKYDVWRLNAGGQWTEMEENVVIGADGVVGTGDTPNAADVLTPRGGAFWLKPADGTSAKNCYLLGQPGAAGSSTIENGKWNLIGNTAGEAKTLTATDFTAEEKVCVPNDGKLVTYTVRGGKWLNGRTKAETISIAVGQGFWFLSKGTDSISWGND